MHQPYEQPKITLLGTLADLTSAGPKVPGGDFMGYGHLPAHGSIPGSPPGDT